MITMTKARCEHLMLHRDVPSFPRGFLLADRPVKAPSSFEPGPLLANFYVHPWTLIEMAGDENLFVIVLGRCVPTLPNLGESPAQALLSALRHSGMELLRSLDDYSGRHAIIFGSQENVSVVTDATAMRSVFYAADGGVIASHAILIEQALGGHRKEIDLPFQYGYPGNWTPYSRARTLTANTYYALKDNKVHRFWPIAPLGPRTAAEAANELLEKSAFALRSTAENKQVRLTLTAGLDSRAILAIALHSGIDFETYTYGDNAVTAVDRAVAADLAAEFGLKHTVIDSRTTSPELKRSLLNSNYSSHHGVWVGALMSYFENITDVAVLGNALEIGRSNSMSFRRYDDSLPITAEAMAKLHYRRMTAFRREQVQKAGIDQYFKISESGFHDFMVKTGFDAAATIVDPFDLFYWEYRMSAWQGHAMNERDFYGESFIPFNARSILASMLGVPEKDRYDDSVVYRMIEMVDPDILNVPINPPQWPLEEPEVSRIHA